MSDEKVRVGKAFPETRPESLVGGELHAFGIGSLELLAEVAAHLAKAFPAIVRFKLLPR